MGHWLVKSEPETYSWKEFVGLGRDHWDGVRNYQARNFIKEMQPDDLVLFYHSGKERRVVGLARVVSEHYPDPTASEGDWAVVDLVPERPLPQPVTLKSIKAEPLLSNIYLVRNARLSVMPLEKEEFDIILNMGKS